MVSPSASADSYEVKHVIRDVCTIQVYSTIGCCACMAVCLFLFCIRAAYNATTQDADEKDKNKSAMMLAFILALVCAIIATVFYRYRTSRFACLISYYLFGNSIGNVIGATSMGVMNVLS